MNEACIKCLIHVSSTDDDGPLSSIEKQGCSDVERKDIFHPKIVSRIVKLCLSLENFKLRITTKFSAHFILLIFVLIFNFLKIEKILKHSNHYHYFRVVFIHNFDCV